MAPGRIAYITSRFPLLTETFILHEVQSLVSLGWSVELFALQHEHPTVAHPAARQIEAVVHYTSVNALAFRDSIQFLRDVASGCARSPRVLARSLLVVPVACAWATRMRQLNVRHIHAHFGTYPALAAMVAAHLQGIDFSFTIHAHDLFADNLMLADKVRRARFVVTISDFNYRRLSALLAPGQTGRIHVIRCGVDVADFRFRPSRPPGTPRKLVCVAALREYKGLPYLVDACARLHRHAEPFVCTIVGEGPQRAALERQIRSLGLDGCVVLHGATDERAVRRLLAEADTFVLPSVRAANRYMDGIPVALMEAMAGGIPVIASRLSGIPELVQHGQTGLLVAPRDSEALAEAILRCWREPDHTSSRALAARALVERDYDLYKNTRALAARFEEALTE
jgi:colanic acid/amylovoran biosynthesis glycosyltransferase